MYVKDCRKVIKVKIIRCQNDDLPIKLKKLQG